MKEELDLLRGLPGAPSIPGSTRYEGGLARFSFLRVEVDLELGKMHHCGSHCRLLWDRSAGSSSTSAGGEGKEARDWVEWRLGKGPD